MVPMTAGGTTRRDETALIRARLRSHGLSWLGRTGALGTPADVVRRLLAVQAQDFPSGMWAIGSRSPGSTAASVTASFDRGEIVRTWPMRGTLHVVAAEDLGWMVRLAAPRVLSSMAGRHRQLELDQTSFDLARDVAERLLGGGGRATRDEFMAALEAAGIATTGQRGPHLVATLAMTGLVCWGPTSGSQQALVLTEEWIGRGRDLTDDEALGEFVVRYLRGHGPATMKDFIWWSKLTVAQAKRGWAVAGDRILETVHGDLSYWSIAEDGAGPETPDEDVEEPADPDAGRSRRVLALPGFDEYLLGYTGRDLVLPPEHFEKIVPGGNGIFLPLIVVDGRIVGTWRRRIAKGTVTITPAPFEPLSARTLTGFASAARAYARFLALSPDIADPVPL